MKLKYLAILLVFFVFAGCAARRRDIEDRIPPRYRGFYNLTKHVLTAEEFEEFLSLPEKEKDDYVFDFWERTNPHKDIMANEFRDILMERTHIADEKFSFGRTMGSDTDRGRILIIYGEPDEIVQRDHDREYDRELRHFGQRRDQDMDIAGDQTMRQNYEYWTYENTFGLRPNTTLTFVDDYSSGHYRLLTNIRALKDRNIPNPLRLFLTEEGRALFRRSSAEGRSRMVQARDDRKALTVNTDFYLVPEGHDRTMLNLLVFLPLQNLIFIENEMRQQLAIIDFEIGFFNIESGDETRKSFRKDIILSQAELQKHQNRASYLVPLLFEIYDSKYRISVNVTDIRSQTQGKSILTITPFTMISIDGISLSPGSLVIVPEDDERVITGDYEGLLLAGNIVKPVYGNVFSRTRSLKLYKTVFVEENYLARMSHEDIVIRLKSKDSGRLISESSHRFELSDNKLLLNTILNVSRIGTGHYEVRVYIQDKLSGKADFYFLR